MPEPRKEAPKPWHVRLALEEVPEEGRHITLTADDEARAAVAKVAGLRDLPRLQAEFDVSRHRVNGLRVAGRVSATVGQTCVVTLEPLTNEIVEDIDLVFVPPAEAGANGHDSGEAEEKRDTPAADNNDAEPLIGGAVDLGALATEFLILGLDPYPRKPGAVFQPPADAAPDEGPFAALAALKKQGEAP